MFFSKGFLEGFFNGISLFPTRANSDYLMIKKGLKASKEMGTEVDRLALQEDFNKIRGYFKYAISKINLEQSKR